ncbi:MAG: flagellar protein FlaG [Porticoccus sp.]|nr:flagellar protein FlaG [Porticoccus sp.]
MDISNLTTMSSVVPTVTKATGGSVAKATSDSKAVQSSMQTGNSLPDKGQVRAGDEDPSVENQVSISSSEELNQLVDQANVALQGRSSDLKFTIAAGTEISVVRIEDAETGELIRQFPSEAMVAIARALDDSQQGAMLEEQA